LGRQTRAPTGWPQVDFLFLLAFSQGFVGGKLGGSNCGVGGRGRARVEKAAPTQKVEQIGPPGNTLRLHRWGPRGFSTGCILFLVGGGHFRGTGGISFDGKCFGAKPDHSLPLGTVLGVLVLGGRKKTLGRGWVERADFCAKRLFVFPGKAERVPETRLDFLISGGSGWAGKHAAGIGGGGPRATSMAGWLGLWGRRRKRGLVGGVFPATNPDAAGLAGAGRMKISPRFSWPIGSELHWAQEGDCKMGVTASRPKLDHGGQSVFSAKETRVEKAYKKRPFNLLGVLPPNPISRKRGDARGGNNGTVLGSGEPQNQGK